MFKIKKKNFIILLVIMLTLIVTISLLVVKVISLSGKTIIKQSLEKVGKQETVKCKNNLEKNENIVFFGDSITYIYPIDEIYDNYQIIGSGVSGYTTNDLLANMEKMLYNYNPTKVIMLIGTNDIMEDNSEEKQKETIVNIQKICKEIKKNRPNAKIYIESIYPVNKNLNEKMVRNRTNEAIENINEGIKKICKEENITYINLFDELIDEDGNFDKKYTGDGLHPVDLGYAKITRIRMPYIYE